MSTRYGKSIRYICFNDCEQTGCPGHIVRAVHHNTSDVLSFEIDGNDQYHVDYNAFKAMVESSKSTED